MVYELTKKVIKRPFDFEFWEEEEVSYKPATKKPREEILQADTDEESEQDGEPESEDIEDEESVAVESDAVEGGAKKSTAEENDAEESDVEESDAEGDVSDQDDEKDEGKENREDSEEKYDPRESGDSDSERDEDKNSEEETDDTDSISLSKLTAEQRRVFKYVRKLLEDPEFYRKNPTAICVQGSAGTGKTEVLKLLCEHYSNTAIFVASSGVAAANYKKGRTAHSMFGFPFNANNYDSQHSNINSWREEEIRSATLIAYDEVNMVDKKLIEMLDRTLTSLMGSNKIFGGKVVVFAADFRQITPVDENYCDGDKGRGVSLMSSKLWTRMKLFQLKTSLRTQYDPAYGTFLNKLSSGKLPKVKLEVDEWAYKSNFEYVPLTKMRYSTQFQDIVDFVYPKNILNNPDECSLRAILSPTKETAMQMNSAILKRLDGTTIICQARMVNDSAILKRLDGTTIICQARMVNDSNYCEDFKFELNADRFFPKKELKLKKGCLCMILRNTYDTAIGNLLVGTKVIVEDIETYGVWIRKPFQKEQHFLQQIYFKSWDTEYFQHPLEVCYAMTIHKSQGQTLSKVGVHIDGTPNHGRLYLALSRVRYNKDVMVLAPKDQIINGTAYAPNTVYNELVV